LNEKPKRGKRKLKHIVKMRASGTFGSGVSVYSGEGGRGRKLELCPVNLSQRGIGGCNKIFLSTSSQGGRPDNMALCEKEVHKEIDSATGERKEGNDIISFWKGMEKTDVEWQRRKRF